jgi:hypothetical protein
VTWNELKLTGPQAVRDLWREKDLGSEAAEWKTDVNSHGAAFICVGTPK